jgi:hypothetical protein
MQQTILDTLFRLHNATTEQQKITYLQNLQPPAHELRNCFNNFPVTVNYARHDIQSVYMLRYFPPYSQVIRTILNTLQNNPRHTAFNGQTIGASFFGCGPCPEIFGFFDYLSRTTIRPQQININTFDVNSDSWAFSRDITFQSVIPTVWGHCPINTINSNLNIASQNSLNAFLPNLRTSNLVVFQNCLNEIPVALHNVVIDNFKTIIANIPQGAIILIIDLFGYPRVLDLLAYFEDDPTLTGTIEILRSSHQGQLEYDAIDLVNLIPPIVRQNLLTGIPYQIQNGLIPRRRIVYHHLAIRKL